MFALRYFLKIVEQALAVSLYNLAFLCASKCYSFPHFVQFFVIGSDLYLGCYRCKEDKMQVKFAEYADAIVVRLDGELDEHTAAQVRQTVDVAIEMCRQRVFIFDFSKLSFMDSTGIGILLGRYKKLKSKGIEPQIYGANRQVDKILQTAGIYSIIKKTS